MSNRQMPVTAMFEELIRLGHIAPAPQMEEMPLPGAFPSVPTIVGYATPEAPIRGGGNNNAELGQHSAGNLYYTGYAERIGIR